MIQQNKSLGTRLAQLSGPQGYHSLEFSTDSARVCRFYLIYFRAWGDVNVSCE